MRDACREDCPELVVPGQKCRIGSAQVGSETGTGEVEQVFGLISQETGKLAWAVVWTGLWVRQVPPGTPLHVRPGDLLFCRTYWAPGQENYVEFLEFVSTPSLRVIRPQRLIGVEVEVLGTPRVYTD